MSPMAEIRCTRGDCDFRCTVDLPGEEGLHQLIDHWTRLDELPEDILKIYKHHTSTRPGKYWGHSEYTVRFTEPEGVFEPEEEKKLLLKVVTCFSRTIS